jgi:hypothetical protein
MKVQSTQQITSVHTWDTLSLEGALEKVFYRVTGTGWSYDMEGGGCFTGGCDDLATFPVAVRNGDIYVDVGSGGKKKG